MTSVPDSRKTDEITCTEASHHALEAAKKQGASHAEVNASMDDGLSVSVRKQEVETLEHHRGQSLSVSVYFGHRKGSASTADLRPEAIQEAVTAACRIARYTSEDPYSGLADAALMAEELPDLDLYHPWAIDAEYAIEIAKACEISALDFDARINNSEGASINTFKGVSVYANTHGFTGLHASSRHSMSCVVIAQDEQGMQRDHDYTTSRVPEQLLSPELVGQSTAKRTLSRLASKRLDTRKAPVLYAADVSRSLLGSFISAISGSALYRKSTFLLDSLGSPIFPDFINISENPFIPQGIGSTAFDGEGVATKKRDIVNGGKIESYVLSSYSARKLGMQTTGNSGGVHNLSISTSGHDLPALLKMMGTGLYVTELIGHGINMVTGDYSRGAAGFWVENGEIQYPVEEITVAGNLRDIFKNLIAVGNDVDLRGNIRTGSWLIEEMTIAGE